MRPGLASSGGRKSFDVRGGPIRSRAASHASRSPRPVAARQVSLISAGALKSPVTTTALPAGSAATRAAIVAAESTCRRPRRSVRCVLKTCTRRPLPRWWKRAQVTMRETLRRQPEPVGPSGSDESQKVPDSMGISASRR